MATSNFFSAQKALRTCSDHEHVEMEMYCKTCRKAVCTKCVKEEHRDHDWDTSTTLAKELRKQTNQKKMEVESISKSILIGTEEALKIFTSDADSELTLNCSALEAERKRIVESVNTSFDEMKSKCSKYHELKTKRIKEKREQLESKGRRLKFLIQNMEIGARDYTDSDLIELHDEIHSILNQLQSPPVLLHDSMVYRPGSANKATLETLVGSVAENQSYPEVILENEINTGDTFTNCIRLLSEDEAWIRSDGLNKLLYITGEIKRTADTGCLIYNFDVSEEGDIYFCHPEAQTVKKYDIHGKIHSLFSTSPLIPLFINLTRSDDLLITLVDEDSSHRNTSSRRLVRRASMTGDLIKEYEYDNDGKTPLFCKPASPIENYNGNICVMNRYQDETYGTRGTVCCIDGRGQLLFKYDGGCDNFNPLDICCDTECNTFVSDAVNRRIHIIDSNGLFVQYLLQSDSFEENIYAVALRDRRLWIGSMKSGLIKVFKFKNK